MKTFKIFLAAASAVSIFSGCNNLPAIDKEYNPLEIVAGESSLTGTFRQGDELTDAKIVLSYRNGLGRQAEILVPEVSGIYADPVPVTLASRNADNNGDGTLEITLKGVPAVKTNIKLRPTIRLATHEVFVIMEITPKGDIVLDAAASTVSGTFKIFQPLEGGKISVNYNSTKPHDVTISVAEVVGVIGPEFSTTLPAAPGGGFVDVPLQGTPTNHGNQNFVIRMVGEGGVEYTMTKPIPIQGEITFDIGASSVTGEFITGEAVTDAFVTLAYTAERDMNMTISIDNVDGIMAAPFEEVLPAGSGTVEIPLSGTPTNDNDKNLTISLIENNVLYTAQITVVMNPGIEFVEETIMFNSLEYKTVFVDVNGNGKATRGEVWLDRNIGATSNNPGTYGASGANTDSFGQFAQWGRPYGSAYDSSWAIDFVNMSPWTTICPEGYEVPTALQWRDAIVKLTGGTPNNNNVTNVPGITEILMASALKLPLPGWQATGDAPGDPGTRGFYWTSTVTPNNNAVWRIEINNNAASSTGSNWAGGEWRAQVRCIKTL